MNDYGDPEYAIVRRLRALREAKGLTQDDLGQLCGWDAWGVDAIETCRDDEQEIFHLRKYAEAVCCKLIVELKEPTMPDSPDLPYHFDDLDFEHLGKDADENADDQEPDA